MRKLKWLSLLALLIICLFAFPTTLNADGDDTLTITAYPYFYTSSDSIIFLMPSMYDPGETGTIYGEWIGTDGTPIIAGTVTLTIKDTLNQTVIENVPMSYMLGSAGVYKYDFTAPNTVGRYVATVVGTGSPTGYGFTEVTVREDSGTILDWLGDNSMFLGLLLIPVVLMISGYIARRTVLVIAAGVFWALLMGYSYTQAEVMDFSDINYALFWASMGMMLVCGLEMMLMRDTVAEEEDKMYDDFSFDTEFGEKEPPSGGEAIKSTKTKLNKTSRVPLSVKMDAKRRAQRRNLSQRSMKRRYKQ